MSITVGDAKHLQDLAHEWAMVRQAFQQARAGGSYDQARASLDDLLAAEQALSDFILELGR